MSNHWSITPLVLATLLISAPSCRGKWQQASRSATQARGTALAVPTQEIPCARFVVGGQTGNGFYGGTSGEERIYETWAWHDGTIAKEKTFADPPRVFHIAIVPNGRYLAQAYRKRFSKAVLVLVSGETGEVTREWEPPPGCEFISNEAGLSSNGKYAAVILEGDISRRPGPDPGGPRYQVGLIDLATLTLTWVGELAGQGAGTIRQIAVSDDARYVAVGGWKNGVALVDGSVQKVLWAGRPPTEVSTGYALFSSDDLTLFTAGSEGCVYAIETKTGKIKGQWWATETGQSIYGHRISCLAMSPDGQWLAAGTGPEGYVYLWNTGSSDPKPRMLPHGEMTVLAVTFSPDSDQLASVVNGTIKIWTVRP